MKHVEKLYRATYYGRKTTHEVIVDKYSGNRYKIVACETCPALIGHETAYGHGLANRHRIQQEEK